MFYKELNENYSEEEIKKNKDLTSEKHYKIKEDLFLKFLSDIEIENRNRCIELFYLLGRFSYKYSFLYFDNYFVYLEKFYNNLDEKTDEILEKYEKLKQNEKNYLDIISDRVFLDLNNLINEVNKHIDEMEKTRKAIKKKAFYV